MRRFVFTLLITTLVLTVPANLSHAQDTTAYLIAAYDADGYVNLFRSDEPPQRIGTQPYAEIHDLTWSPDGKHLAFVTISDTHDYQITLLDVHNNTHTDFPIGALRVSDFPISFSADGRSIIYGAFAGSVDTSLKYEYEDWAEVYKLPLQPNTTPQTIGYFQYAMSWGGNPYPADWTYWQDSERYPGFAAENPGFGRILVETPYGLLHSSGIWGSGRVKLFNPETSEDTAIPVDFFNIAVSADHNQIIGAVGSQIALTDLATLDTNFLPTREFPEVFAWGNKEEIFYSTRSLKGNLLDGLSRSEREMLREKYGLESIPIYQVEVYQMNIQTKADVLLYSEEAYIISRLMPAPDGKELYFSQIPNMEDWLKQLLSETQNAQDTWTGKPSLYRLNVATGQVDLIGEGVYNATMNFTYHGE